MNLNEIFPDVAGQRQLFDRLLNDDKYWWAERGGAVVWNGEPSEIARDTGIDVRTIVATLTRNFIKKLEDERKLVDYQTKQPIQRQQPAPNRPSSSFMPTLTGAHSIFRS